MPHKSAEIITTAVILSMATFSIVSCKKQEPPVRTKAPEATRTACSDDVKEEQLDPRLLTMQGRKLSSEEVKKLEEKLEAVPHDLTSRTKLLGWYSQKRFSSEPAHKARHKHILWLIQNHPDAQITGTHDVGLDPVLDKEVYYEAKKLWLKQSEAHKTNTAVLGNAANFFFIYEKDIAEELLKKAQALEPENPKWPEELGQLYRLGLIGKSTKSKTETAAEALRQLERSLTLTTSEREKFYKLTKLAKVAFEASEMNKAETYAKDLLAQATQYKNDWNYGNAIHHGNIILGRLALMSGDLDNAKKRLIEAGKTPGSPQLNSFGPNMTLAKELLEKNEREVVIRYFELCANFWEMGQDRLKDWTAIVKEGRMPHFQMNLQY